MMDNKLSELSKPVAWKFKNADGGDRVSLERKANIYGRHDFQPLYSQEYVSALDKVAQFWIGESAGWKQRAEDAEKRIAELEAIREAAEKLVRCKGRYHSEQNYRTLAALFGVTTPDLPPVEGDSEAVIAELSANLAELETHNKCLIKKNADLTQQNIKLGERLAAPVRLPALLDAPSEYASSILWAERDTHNATVIKFADAIRAAGFKVEGDE